MVVVVDMGANGEVALAEEAHSVAVAARVAGSVGVWRWRLRRR